MPLKSGVDNEEHAAVACWGRIISRAPSAASLIAAATALAGFSSADATGMADSDA